MSTTKSSIAFCDFTSQQKRYKDHHASTFSLYRMFRIVSAKHGDFLGNHGLLSLKNNKKRHTKFVIKMDMNAANDVHQGAPLPSGSNFPGWSNWMLGAILSLFLPFMKSKLGPLQTLKNEVDTALETVEKVAEEVENMAVEIEKISEEVAKKLPDDAKLKAALLSVDKLAKEAVKDADMAEAIIHKVEEAEKEVEKLLETAPVNVVDKKST
ncbi:hypothetical protein GIB67_042975 [Kingdonia uniflora]|uniref:Uncharacterized protein n=1 Tax=Kingdonia uniflora TaxID=39325 RepID=A0A7J7NSV4_9MAGN|nr:hypothetical protein GIB67_042975 [Kingdonia uniflora]